MELEIDLNLANTCFKIKSKGRKNKIVAATLVLLELPQIIWRTMDNQEGKEFTKSRISFFRYLLPVIFIIAGAVGFICSLVDPTLTSRMDGHLKILGALAIAGGFAQIQYLKNKKRTNPDRPLS